MDKVRGQPRPVRDGVSRVLAAIKKEVARYPVPVVGVIAEDTHDPFCVLVSCLISLRTRDATTAAASARLFRLAQTPQAMAALSVTQIEKAIYPAAFYRNKAKNLQRLCLRLLDHHGGVVPQSLETLLTLPGVGRKTANLVVTVAWHRPGICVDTHVHRIGNRLGWIKTKTADDSEQALRQFLPKRHWITLNDRLVPFGQFVCRPISPFCSRCPIAAFCEQIGVTTRR